jgi:hypothetical protein
MAQMRATQTILPHLNHLVLNASKNHRLHGIHWAPRMKNGAGKDYPQLSAEVDTGEIT